MHPLLLENLTFTSFAGIFITFILIVLAFWVNQWLLSRTKDIAKTRKLLRQIVSFFIVLIGTILLIVFIPEQILSQPNKEQVLTILGAVFSGAIALSSTTLLGNIIGGLMNQAIDELEIGAFIKVGEYFGCVKSVGLLYTAIQTDDSSTLNIPNLYITSNPVRLYSKTNPFVSATLSLGYDVHHDDVKKYLAEAVERAGLTNAVVVVDSLGDFSIVYTVHGRIPGNKEKPGLLGKSATNEQIKDLLGKRSELKEEVLNVLHLNEVEIVSPTFMNQRQTPEIFIPSKRKIQKSLKSEKEETNVSETLLSETADEVGKQNKKDELVEKEEEIKKMKEDIKEIENDYSKELAEQKLDALVDEKKRLEEELNQEKKEE